jgi:hypothetical protein
MVHKKITLVEMFVRVCLVGGFWRGGEGRWGNILNEMCLVQFLGGEGRGGEQNPS